MLEESSDSDHPARDRGKEKSHEGADKVLAYRPLGNIPFPLSIYIFNILQIANVEWLCLCACARTGQTL
jgi:hypothetical protein